MADLSIDFAGIKSPNPFWLASAPPANTRRADHARLRRRLGRRGVEDARRPHRRTSRAASAASTTAARKLMGLNNIELITDRPLEVNLREIREVKKRYPKHAVIASLMVETKDDWKDIIQQAPRTPAPTASS